MTCDTGAYCHSHTITTPLASRLDNRMRKRLGLRVGQSFPTAPRAPRHDGKPSRKNDPFQCHWNNQNSLFVCKFADKHHLTPLQKFLWLCFFKSATTCSSAEVLSEQFSVLVTFHQGLIKRSIVSVLRCLLYTSPSPRDQRGSRMPSSA